MFPSTTDRREWDSTHLPSPDCIPKAEATVGALQELGCGMHILVAFVYMVHCNLGLANENHTVIGSTVEYEMYYCEIAYAIMSTKFEQAKLPVRDDEKESEVYALVQARKEALSSEHGAHASSTPKFFAHVPQERMWGADDEQLPELVAYVARTDAKKRKKSTGLGGGSKGKKSRTEEDE